MAVLGHSNIGTTMNIYAHVAPELVQANADRMQRALGPIGEQRISSAGATD